MVLRGTNELPWFRGFQIGVILDSFLKFLKSGALRVTLRMFKEAQEANRCQIWSYGAPMSSPDPEDFKLVSHLVHF